MVFELTTDNERPSENTEEPTTSEYFYKYFMKFITYLAIFGLFTINLIAVTISLSCNSEESLPFKILSALYALFFGVMYIIFNYYIYRVQIKGEITKCKFCRTNPFGFGPKKKTVAQI